MTSSRIHKLPLLLLAVVAFLSLSLPRIYTFAMQQVEVSPDNSVLLANALGLRRNFDESITEPICFIKIHSVQVAPLVDGISYIYTVQGCVTNDFSRRFGVCRNGDCNVKPYQVQVFVPTTGEPATVQNIRTQDQYTTSVV